MENITFSTPRASIEQRSAPSEQTPEVVILMFWRTYSDGFFLSWYFWLLIG
jgi:hypothetical protein